MRNKYSTHSIDETYGFAKELVDLTLEPGMTIALIGDLGVGKTTFVKGVANALGIEDEVTSPTFILLQTHDIESSKTDIKRLHHLDLYRRETLDEVYDLGIEELFADDEAIVLIEWANKVKELLPDDTLEIRFESVGEDEREIIVGSNQII